MRGCFQLGCLLVTLSSSPCWRGLCAFMYVFYQVYIVLMSYCERNTSRGCIRLCLRRVCAVFLPSCIIMLHRLFCCLAMALLLVVVELVVILAFDGSSCAYEASWRDDVEKKKKGKRWPALHFCPEAVATRVLQYIRVAEYITPG